MSASLRPVSLMMPFLFLWELLYYASPEVVSSIDLAAPRCQTAGDSKLRFSAMGSNPRPEPRTFLPRRVGLKWKARGNRMKANIIKGLCILALAVLIGCSAERPKTALTYYHGQTPPDSYFEVVNYTPQEIEFRIKVKFGSKHMYHLILEGDEPLAEGWFPTVLGAADSNGVVIT